jgi:Immunity protein Imm1
VHIQDLQHEHEVGTLEEFERVLAKRYENEVNAFWINRGGNRVPLLLILVNKAYAYMFYFPSEDGHPGFHSVGRLPELDPDQDTIFFMNRIEEPEGFPNFAVIELADALAAAKEFFASTALPQCVEWFEL